MNEYEICLDNRAIGKAKFSKMGMYTVVSCSCKLPQDQMYDVFIEMTDTAIPIGILVPTGNEMGTKKHVHSNELTGEVIRLTVSQRVSTSEIPVEPCKPFPNIRNIKKLKVVKRENLGEIRLIVT